MSNEPASPPPAVKNSTLAGNYFISNYPPFSFWSEDQKVEVEVALNSEPVPGTKLGVYHHIPFCRKRCHFCYFRVYTDKNAKEIADYIQVLVREWELYARQAAVAGRPLNFVYFGGGTPSFLSTAQLQELVGGLSASAPWTEAEEITFECEPGTLTEGKLAA